MNDKLYMITVLIAAVCINNSNPRFDVLNTQHLDLSFSTNCSDTSCINQFIYDVNKNIKNYQYQAKDIYPSFSDNLIPELYRLGSSNVELYTKNKLPVKIVATYEGDRENLITEYYINNGLLIYATKKRQVFDPPKWQPNSLVKTEDVYIYYLVNSKIGIGIKNKIPIDKYDYELSRNSLCKEVNKYIAYFGGPRIY